MSAYWCKNYILGFKYTSLTLSDTYRELQKPSVTDHDAKLPYEKCIQNVKPQNFQQQNESIFLRNLKNLCACGAHFYKNL